MVMVPTLVVTRVGMVVIVLGRVAVRPVVMLVLGAVAIGAMVMLVLGRVTIGAVVMLVLGRVIVGSMMMGVVRFVSSRRGAASDGDCQGRGQQHQSETKRGSDHGGSFRKLSREDSDAVEQRLAGRPGTTSIEGGDAWQSDFSKQHPETPTAPTS